LLGLLFWVLIWGTVMAIHAMFAFDPFRRRFDQAVQRELERETPVEKPKHQYVDIGDDGELVDLREEAPAARRSRRNT
jgi:hypothetical protein